MKTAFLLSPQRKQIMLMMLFTLLALSGIGYIGQATYIHAKATLAQLLMETAWSKTEHGHKEVKPWPWADTWPVARLNVPKLGIHRIVLAGATGSSLAFGPGHLFDSALPGQEGNVILSGHRDTHFAFLEDLHSGEIITLELADIAQSYRVKHQMVIDTRETTHIPNTDSNDLILITCYPFNAIQAGGPLRYVVYAEPTKTSLLL